MNSNFYYFYLDPVSDFVVLYFLSNIFVKQFNSSVIMSVPQSVHVNNSALTTILSAV